ncbi:MAG: bifunctional (p)ppGpp synthetase/guanosine-3',5'-bis(diphosphate) 3'-pyrophosphohydrolase [Methylococcaceae bacterium]|nr:MAG: bifunctional (p)ppGpp synthetase/guanosine-3',5'-bis(diphosphate) 3'-pyrophosphohydrolase [Methylococcaceae bacterium]
MDHVDSGAGHDLLQPKSTTMNPSSTTPQPAHHDEAELRRQLCQGYDAQQCERIGAALSLALQAAAQDDKPRPRGIDAARIVHQLKADAGSVTVALLCDPKLRETLPQATINQRFGAETAELVQKVNWLNTFTDYRDAALLEPEQAELLRRMLLAVVNDVRAVLIKLAYRLERLRLLAREDYTTRRSIAQETLDIFVPLANRLGVAQLKWEMEDLAFRYLNPLEYGSLAKQLAETRVARESYVQHFTEELKQLLRQEQVSAKVYGRPKHIHSIWKKLQRKHLALDELYDLRAVRVIVDSITDCYTVLGIVHNRWSHIAKEFDDYIANRKPNGYQSLHTVVLGAEGKAVEIQIRTHAMHTFAEYGVAAHWRYKEGGGAGRDDAFERSIALLRGLLENPGDNHALLENFRLEAQGNDVFVLSPKGRIVRLVRGATPLDFAYAIHTEVGHRCRGAKVDGRMVPLTYTLHSGEQVEVLTGNQPAPSRHWLEPGAGFLHSSDARAKVRQWFKQLDFEQHWRQGKTIFDKERQRLGLREVEQKTLLDKYRYKRWEDLLAAVGRGEITAAQLAGQLALTVEHPAQAPRPQPARKPPRPRGITQASRKPPRPGVQAQVCIPGIPHAATQLAGCCKPEFGDALVGYLSVNRGLMIHKRDCANIQSLTEPQRQRLIGAYWEGDDGSTTVELHVTARDRRGLLRDVTQVLSNEGLDISKAFTYTDPNNRRVSMQISVEQATEPAMDAASEKIRRLDGVVAVRRVSG